MAALNFDIAVIGHFSNDHLKLPIRAEPYNIMGGAVAYVSLITRRLGGSAAVISKVGYDFPDSYMQKLIDAGVDISGIVKKKGEQTTSFELTYSQDLSSRTLRLRHQGSPITVADLPSSLYAKVVHIGPIAGEISYDVIKRLRGCCEYMSIDPQGMTRRFGSDGVVANSVEMDKRLLRLTDVYKSSFDEVKTLTGISDLEGAVRAIHKCGPKIVIVTMGSEGSILSANKKICSVPVYCSDKIIDPTGAGDVFIGAFMTEYIHNPEKPFWCACVGSAAASLVIEGVGASFFGTKAEIYRRAKSITDTYNKSSEVS